MLQPIYKFNIYDCKDLDSAFHKTSTFLSNILLQQCVFL